MPHPEKIVAVGLLTEKEMHAFGSKLKQVYPIPKDGTFDDLLAKISQVSAEAARERSGRLAKRSDE